MGLRRGEFFCQRRICCYTLVHLISTFVFITNLLVGYSEAAPAQYDGLATKSAELSETLDRPSLSLEATVVSFGLLITLVIFIMLCSGGCCLNVFGKRRGTDTIETRGFDNPIARLGENSNAVPMSPIDVRDRALTLDPIVFEPLPSINILTPLSSNFYNSLPRVDPNHHPPLHPQNHLREATVESPLSHPSSVHQSTEDKKSDSVVRNNGNNVYVEPGDEHIKVSASSSQWVTFSSSSNDDTHSVIENKSLKPEATTTTTIITAASTPSTASVEPTSFKLLVEEDDFLNTSSSVVTDSSNSIYSILNNNNNSKSQSLGISVIVSAPTPTPSVSVNIIQPTPTPTPSSSILESNDTSSISSSIPAIITTNGISKSIETLEPDNTESPISIQDEVVILSTSSNEEYSNIIDESENSSQSFLNSDDTVKSLTSEESENIKRNKKIRPIYRKTSTPNHSPASDGDGFNSQNSSFFLRNEDVFEDFSMELTTSYSPIEKNPQSGREWQPTLHENQSLVMMGASDELGLKPYQRVTTELENDINFQSAMDEVPQITNVTGSQSMFSTNGNNDMSWTDSGPMSLTVTGTYNTVLDEDHQKQPLVPRKLVFDDTSVLETSTGAIIDANSSSENSHAEATITNTEDDKENERSGDTESGHLGFTFLDELPVTPFSKMGPTAPDTVIKPKTSTTTTNEGLNTSRDSIGNKTESECEGIGEMTPPQSLFKIGQDKSTSYSGFESSYNHVDSGPGSRDKFVEDIEAAAEEMGSLVLTDLEEDFPTVQVVKETREVEVESYVEGIGKLQRGNLFEKSIQDDDDTGNSSGIVAANVSSEVETEEDGGEISYIGLNSTVEIVKDKFDNSRTLLVGDDSDNEDENDSESICRDFVPSKWNQNLAPIKPAISQRSVRSPEHIAENITNTTDDSRPSLNSSISNNSLEKSSLKKSVSFERKKTQLVYEYPPPPCDSDEDEKHAARSLVASGGHFNLSLDWELQPDELEHQSDMHQDDWEDDIVHSRENPTENPMDMYRISGFDNFQVRPSKEPFLFQSVPPPLTFPWFAASSSSSTTSSLLPSTGLPGLGELRHTRERLKLDLSKGEVGETSLLDSEAGDTKSSTVKLQQIDSGVGSSSTNVSPFL